MANKKIIGILGIPSLDEENFPLVGIYDEIWKSVIKKNAIPFMIIPPSCIDYVNTKNSDISKLSENEKNLLQDMVDLCDGIILPGGYRIYEYYTFVAKYAIEKDIPILGICMGMQLLAVIDNQENVIEQNGTKINHKQRGEKYVHDINIVENTILRDIVKTEHIKVNSRHNYHVTKTNQFIVSSYAEDGLIESIELPNKKFVVGVQWHPEAMLDYDEYANKLYDRFMEKC